MDEEQKYVIYIAGPFRAKTAWEIEQNVRKAEEQALKLWEAGFVVICPHTNTRFFHEALPDNLWLNGDLEILRRCDLVFMLDTWQKSTGAKVEKQFAESLFIDIVYTIEEAKEWMVKKNKEYQDLVDKHNNVKNRKKKNI